MKENVHELHVCRHLRSLPDEDVSSSTLRPPDRFGACWQRELRPGDSVPPSRPGWISGSRPPPPAGAATTLPAAQRVGSDGGGEGVGRLDEVTIEFARLPAVAGDRDVCGPEHLHVWPSGTPLRATQ